MTLSELSWRKTKTIFHSDPFLNVKSGEAHFKNLSLRERLSYLRSSGNYLDSRYYGSYRIHLYEARGFYAEVWMRIDLDQVCWIEIANKDMVAENYTSPFDSNSDLGI